MALAANALHDPSCARREGMFMCVSADLAVFVTAMLSEFLIDKFSTSKIARR